MTYRSLYAALAASTCIVALATPATAQTRSYNIPASDLATALDRFARQSGVQIVYKVDEVQGKRSKLVRGSLDADDALRRLLSGSGFEARRDGANAFAVVRVGNGQDATADGNDQSAGIAEILVVGSRSQNVDIRRSEDDAQPYVTFSADDIEKSQASSLEDFLRKALPMNTQAGATSQGRAPQAPLGASIASNTSSINLRGLGPTQTLILVDGRRAPRSLSANGSDFNQADINGIPLAAIERVEILPSSAGGIYGGGAVGGVINIIRKHGYKGLDVKVQYGAPFSGGGEARRIDLSGGFVLEGGKTEVSFSASASQSNPFYMSENNLWRRGRDLYIKNEQNGGSVIEPNPLSGGTANICSSIFGFACASYIAYGFPDFGSDIPLSLDDGTLLGSSRTFVPRGYAGPISAGDGGRALLANAGNFNLELPDGPEGKKSSLLNNPRVLSAGLNIRRKFGSSLDAFVDVSASENKGRFSTSFTPVVVNLLADSPGNPFQQDVLVRVPADDFENPGVSRVRTFSASGGLIARIGRGWAATLEYSYSRSDQKFDSQNNQFDVGALSTEANNGAIDLLKDTKAYPLDLSPYLVPGSTKGVFTSIQKNASFRVSGPLIRLPGGNVVLTGLLERRTESAPQSSYTNFGLNLPAQIFVQPDRSQEILTEYAELSVPLVAEANAMPGVRALELTVSLRHDGYKTTTATPPSYIIQSEADPRPDLMYQSSKVHSTDFTGALRWMPVNDIALRASYSSGFLPPSLSQSLTFAPIPCQSFFRDPKRGNEALRSDICSNITGSNGALLPETSKSFSAGLILTPTFLQGFRLSVDYTQIRKSGEITSFNPQQMIANEESFPGRVIRASSNLPGDLPGWSAPIVKVYDGPVNIDKSRVQALDFQADYQFSSDSVGNFRLYAVATRQIEFTRRLLSSSQSFDTVDFFDGPLKWRGNGGVSWTMGPWSVDWNSQYYSGYSVLYGNPTGASTGQAQVGLQGSDRIPSQWYHDVLLGWKIDGTRVPALNGMTLNLGVQNVFNKKPPVFAASLYGYSAYGDPRLRRFTITLSKHFGPSTR